MKNKINSIGLLVFAIGIILILIGIIYPSIDTTLVKKSNNGKNSENNDNVIEVTVNNEYEVQVNDVLKTNEGKYRVIGVKSTLNSDGTCDENNSHLVLQSELGKHTIQSYLTPREEDAIAMEEFYITISKCSDNPNKISIKVNEYEN